MGVNREYYYSRDEIRKFNSIEQMKNWIWDKRSYDFLLEEMIMVDNSLHHFLSNVRFRKNKWLKKS